MRGVALAISLLGLGSFSCGTQAPRPAGAVRPAAPAGAEVLARPPAPGALIGEYAATWDQATGVVQVEARLAASAGSMLALERGAEPFARDIEAAADRDGAPWVAVERRGGHFEAAPCANAPCRLRYRYALREASQKIDDLDTASEESELVEAPPSTWLLAPAAAATHDQRLRFRVTTSPGSRFVTGIFHAKDAPDAWDIALDDLWTAPYSAFGALRVRSVPVTGGAVQLAISPGTSLMSEDDLARWTSDAGRAVSSYYGRFPMPGALVLVAIARGRWVGSGRTLSGGGGTVFVRVGEKATAKAYRDDWVLVHEMVHLTFPSVARDQDWAEEGIATYVEPFARVRAGLLTAEEAWAGLANGLPNGLPAPGDQGLDHTHTWGRTYWGGALFWFLADVAIHKRTNNRLGLEHALRGVIDAGGTNAVRWPLAEVLRTGDQAVGVPVLTELHAAMGAAPHPVDLKALLASLGVATANGHVRFDDQAPLADVRRAITHGTETR